MNTWYRWCKGKGISAKIETLSKPELDRLLTHFFNDVRKIDGGNYEPGSLNDFQRSIERYLQEDCGKTFSIIRDPDFKLSRKSLDSKRKQLRNTEGKGRKPNKGKQICECLMCLNLKA